MAIVHKWQTEDEGIYTRERFGNDVCSLSGKPLEPPFMQWFGELEFFINASSLYLIEAHNVAGFLHDIVGLVHIASHKGGYGVGSRRGQS
jgi:hypothetical protein